jgi:hypothetical protein
MGNATGKNRMSELTNKITAMEHVLAQTMTFDRFIMDQAFSQISGLDLAALDPKMKRKLNRILSGFGHLAVQYPDATDPTKPLPATALVAYAKIMQDIRDLAH